MLLLNYSQPLELSGIIESVDTFLRTNMSPEGVIVCVAILALYCIIALALIYIERKITAFFQARLGPNRLGPYGVIQSIADMVKILIKEIIHINRSDKFLFYAAPFFVIVSSFLELSRSESTCKQLTSILVYSFILLHHLLELSVSY